MLLIIVGVLACPFMMFVPKRDANMHAKHRTARIARHVGDSRGDLLYIYFF